MAGVGSTVCSANALERFLDFATSSSLSSSDGSAPSSSSSCSETGVCTLWRFLGFGAVSPLDRLDEAVFLGRDGAAGWDLAGSAFVSGGALSCTS